MPLILEPGLAKKVPAGSKLVFQMHYTPNGKAQKDRSSVGLVFAKEPPTREVVTLPVFNYFFRIPAGAKPTGAATRSPATDAGTDGPRARLRKQRRGPAPNSTAPMSTCKRGPASRVNPR